MPNSPNNDVPPKPPAKYNSHSPIFCHKIATLTPLWPVNYRKGRHGGKASHKANSKKNRQRKRREEASARNKANMAELERKLLLAEISANAAALLIAELAPGMANYNFLNCGKGHPKHAKKVEANKYHDERVAKEEDGYTPLAPGTACILNDAFVLAHLTNDGYLTGMPH